MSSLASEEIAGLGFEQVVRGAPLAISVIDASGQVIYSNAQALELTTRQLGSAMPADLAGAIDIFHPDGRRYERDEWPAVRSLTSGEEVAEEEFFFALPNGGRLFIRCSSSPVRDKDGEIVAAVLAMSDITERKRQGELLTYLAGLLDNTDDGVVAMDERYFLTVWNESAERLYGWTAAEVVGLHADEVTRTNLNEDERGALRRELAENGRWRGEVAVARKDGTTVDVELVSVALRGQQGEIMGYLTIHRGIGERKRTEEALRVSTRRSETILESITDAFVSVDQNWLYTDVNDRALARMSERKGTALSREGVLGRSMWELFPEAIGTELDRQCHRAMRARSVVEFETYFADSGEWIEAHAYPSGSGLSIYYRNASARRQAEEALKQAQEQREAADARLEGVREAERSRIARDLHDGALQGLTHALAVTGWRRGSRHDELHGILQQVGLQLRAAIYDLRLDHEGERSFSDALRELVELHREMAPNCEVTLETDPDLPSGSFGDRGTEVLRIIGEALTNACQHARAGNIVVRVTGPETRLSVEVSDDGHGFDPDRPTPALHGQGLRGMRERAAHLGARLDLLSAQTGTTVRLEVRLSPA
jgi:PAS domain S-box-containing protein